MDAHAAVPLSATPAWQALAAHRRKLEGVHMRALFEADPDRFERFALHFEDLLVDLSKHRIDARTLPLLRALAVEADVAGWTRRMFAGDEINSTEKRAVLHVALRNRSDRPMFVDGRDVMPDVRRVLEQMRTFTDAVRSGRARGFSGKPLRDVVNLGIGGSDLGPAMATEALAPYASRALRVHFVSNVDGAQLLGTLADCAPETTLFIVASKTFTTQETLTNAHSARRWLLDAAPDDSAVAQHFVALSTNASAVERFGIAPERRFEFWDWVGGRYSLWSAIGLPIALAVGFERFEGLLEGAHAMDEHFRNAPPEQNLPLTLALLGVWYTGHWDAGSHAILPYDQSLHRLPAYLQQADMESNGKRVTRDGHDVTVPTGPIVWGEPGTNGQHAFFQLLHQGTHLVPADFLAPIEPQHTLLDHHRILLANCLAQSEALMRGKTPDEVRADLVREGLSGEALEALVPHRTFPGNRPSTTILFRRLTPRTLGMLIALYEHRIFVQGILWRINSFDQWGVELGKQLAKTILEEITADPEPTGHDASTHGLLRAVRAGLPR